MRGQEEVEMRDRRGRETWGGSTDFFPGREQFGENVRRIIPRLRYIVCLFVCLFLAVFFFKWTLARAH